MRSLHGPRLSAWGSVPLLAIFVAVAGSIPGCDCSPTSGGGASPEGGLQDSGPPVEASAEAAPADAAPADAADAAPTCTKHLPAGFTQVEASQAIVASLNGQQATRAQSMALDENDDPVLAYVTTNSDSTESLYFVRWDPCAGQFTTPLLVSALPFFVSSIDIALAYDKTTKNVGIAYVMPVTTSSAAVWLATMKAPTTTFTLEALSDDTFGGASAGSPSIAMQNGQIAVGLWGGPFQDDNCASAGVHGSCYIAYLLTSTSTPSSPIESDGPPSPVYDGGYTGITYDTVDDGGPNSGPYYFEYHPTPFTGAVVGDEGWLDSLQWSGAISVAFDSSGVAGIAAENQIYDSGPNNEEVAYWQVGSESAVVVGAPYLGQDDELSLVYEGTKPRILARLANTAPADDLTFFTSDDGVTWSAGVAMPTNGGSQFSGSSSSLAFDGAGHWGAVSDLGIANAGSGTCGDTPLVYTSSDDGTTWSLCGVDPLDIGYNAMSASAAFGTSRIAGTLAISFVTETTNPYPDGGAPEPGGLYYWQHP